MILISCHKIPSKVNQLHLHCAFLPLTVEVLQGWLRHSHTDADRAAVRGAGRTTRINPPTLWLTDNLLCVLIHSWANVWAYKVSDLDAKNMVCVLPSSSLWFLSTMKPIFRQNTSTAGCLKDGEASRPRSASIRHPLWWAAGNDSTGCKKRSNCI